MYVMCLLFRSNSIYSDSSHTDAETVVQNRRSRRSHSPRSRPRSNENLDRGNYKIEFAEPRASSRQNSLDENNSVELNELRSEIQKLKQRIEDRNGGTLAPQPKPIIKTPVQSDSESKQIKLFSKLKNEVQKLRNEVMKVKNKRYVFYIGTGACKTWWPYFSVLN